MSARRRPSNHRPSSQKAQKQTRAPRRVPRKLTRKALGFLFGGLGLACALVVVLCLWLWGRDDGGGASDSGFVRVELIESDPRAVAAQLAEQGLVSDLDAFFWYQRVFLPNAVFETGPHWIPRRNTPEQLVQLLARHRSRRGTKVLVPEGYDLFQIAERLEKLGICSALDFRAAALDARQAGEELHAVSYEGYLYPATYELRLNTHPLEVRRRMSEQAVARFSETFRAAPAALHEWTEALGFQEHELVVLASVVQKETAARDEVGTIAGVFRNRLTSELFRPRGVLQSDPTAGYGCKLPDAPASCSGFSGAITPALLRDASNRYNTYKHPGLPPGPISNPGAETLGRVLQAARTDYFYFYAASGGRHVFSRSYDEHRAAISGRVTPGP